MPNCVLIVDDDIWMQRILSKTLQSYGFNDTFLASDGFEGIAIAVEEKPILIILDILMPELSGHLTLKILKTIKATKDIPVVMVSALSDTENLGLAVKYGTVGFISKPFTRSTVYEKLVSIFGRDRLEKISKGEEIILKPSDSRDVYEDISYNYNEPLKENLNIDLDIDKPEKKASIDQDKLLKHYQDDEQRSIDSIKKLLLKSKK